MSTWVFLRGLARESRHWGNFPATFQAEIANASIISPDLPGNGQRNHCKSPLSVPEMVDCCREELKCRGFSPPFHLLGLSLGAMVAVEWATAYPQEILPSVLINTSLRPFSPFYQRLRPRNYPSLLALATLNGNAEKAVRTIWHMTSARGDPKGDVIDDWVSIRIQNPVTRLNALRQLIAAARYRAPSRPPDVPLLVLAAAKDGLVNPQCSQQLAHRWRAAHAVHPDAGHDLPLDDGAWVARQVREWLVALPHG